MHEYMQNKNMPKSGRSVTDEKNKCAISIQVEVSKKK